MYIQMSAHRAFDATYLKDVEQYQKNLGPALATNEWCISQT